MKKTHKAESLTVIWDGIYTVRYKEFIFAGD